MTTITVKKHPTEENTTQIFVDSRDETSAIYNGDVTKYPMLEATIDVFNRTIEYKGVVHSINDIGSWHDLAELFKPTLETSKEMERGWLKDRLSYQYQELGWMWRETRNCPEGFVMRSAGQMKAGDVIVFTKENPEQEPLNYKGDEHDNKIVQLPEVITKTMTLTKITLTGHSIYDLFYIEDGEEKSFYNNGCAVIAVKKRQ